MRLRNLEISKLRNCTLTQQKQKNEQVIYFVLSSSKMFFSLVVVIVALATSVEAYYSAKSWQSLSKYPVAEDYPEHSLLSSKPNTAIAFTGGGSRAYVASLGYLAGLYQLDLLKNVRYMGGISGGSWATTTFTYAQNAPDNVLLGPVANPEQLTQQNLLKMDPKCARGYAAANLTAIGIKAYHDKLVTTVGGAWCYGVSKTYLEPAGILPGKKFSWNTDSVNDIVKRNRNLKASDFQIPVNPNRPYPIIGTSLVGPSEGAPYTKTSQNYTMIEITPLYVGQFKNLDVKYDYGLVSHSKRIGGAVEPFAFAVNGTAPLIGMASDHSSATLNVPEPIVSLDLAYAAGASSYAPGSLLESLRPPDLYSMGLHFTYWSPTNQVPKDEDYLFADGGAFENIPLISFIQRRVQKIVLFYVSSTPLAPSSKYNPYTDPYTGDKVSDSLSSFFGVLDPDYMNWENRSLEYEKNQVFSSVYFAPVVTALQQAQANGKGMFTTFNLTTVENTWWGVPAGLNFDVTFSYLGRLKTWESKLTTEMQPLLIPKENADDLSVDVDSGPYKSFPHYATLGGDISYEKANVLADLTGWSVLQNADYFRQILS
jgi:hypothetical protein